MSDLFYGLVFEFMMSDLPIVIVASTISILVGLAVWGIRRMDEN